MSFTVRPLATISALIRGDLRRTLPESDANIWPNNLSVLAKVFAAAAHLIDHRGAWLYRQIFVSTTEAKHLERHAYDYGMARKPASRATGVIELTGAANTIYPAGIGFVSASTLYRSYGDALSGPGGALSLAVVAQDNGVAGNRDAGAVLALVDVALYPALSPTGTVTAGGIGGGADIESDDSFRARVLDRKRRPPNGGSESDYEQWARAVPGVSAAWCRRFVNGPGTLGVWFLFEGRPNNIPTDADRNAVQDALDLRRMIRAEIVVIKPVATPINITIRGLTSDNTETRAAIATSLRAMFLEKCRPGAASDPFILSRSWIGEAISSALGEARHELVLPAQDFTYYQNEYPVLGTVTYV